MKSIIVLFTGLAVCSRLSALAATPLTESIFTEVIREANVVNAAAAVTPAKPNALFRVPDRVRTGPASRVELTAPDHTITRVGANSVFTFESEQRTISLEKGSVLFYSPAGAGGGRVQHHGTAAAVLGTTMLCAVLPDGSFKVLDLEGRVQVTQKNGQVVDLKPGQMVIVSEDGGEFRRVEDFDLAQVVFQLTLVVGFSHPLASLPLIEAAIQVQNQQIATGEIKFLASTDAVLFGFDTIVKSPPQMEDHTTLYVSPTHGVPAVSH